MWPPNDGCVCWISGDLVRKNRMQQVLTLLLPDLHKLIMPAKASYKSGFIGNIVSLEAGLVNRSLLYIRLNLGSVLRFMI